MKILKILLCGLLMTLPVWAEEQEDRQTATSLRYVSHELDTRQNKLSAGTNAAVTYTNTAGSVQQRTVKSDLNGGSTTDTSLPTVAAVNTGLNQKQDDIGAINDHTAVTYTGQTGTIGQKGIYQDSGTYATQSDNLIDAKTFNAALKNGLDNEFVCADRPDAYAPGTTTCWLWEIHNTYNAAAQPYVSATGTVVQNGTPTPTNPIYPTFYRQGDMVLRRVGDYADSYDATTHKITRRVGVKVLDGTEDWFVSDSYLSRMYNLTIDNLFAQAPNIATNRATPYSTHFGRTTNWVSVDERLGLIMGYKYANIPVIGLGYGEASNANLPAFKSWLAEQYAGGTPVTVYYPLETPVEEDWPETTYNENVYIPQNQ